MRWLLIAVTLSTVAMVGFVVAQSPKAPPNCTQEGTAERDIMTGTKGPDVLCAKGGDDYAHGDGGNDIIRAGGGRDVLVGAGGRDVLAGGPRADRLFAVDGRGGDRVVGGKGRDQCYVDEGDRVRGCERIFRGVTIDVVRGLTRTAFDLMVIAEQATTTTIVIGPGTIITHPPLPECSPPPPVTPTPC